MQKMTHLYADLAVIRARSHSCLTLTYRASSLEDADVQHRSCRVRVRLVIDIICITSQMTKVDITLIFSAYRVLHVCGTLT